MYKKIPKKQLNKIQEETGIKYTPYKMSNPDRELQKKLEQHNSCLEEYYKILELQNNVCAICHGKDRDKRLCVDHDHETNKFRGLLCWNCNVALGHFRDNIDNLNRAIIYLSKSRIY